MITAITYRLAYSYPPGSNISVNCFFLFRCDDDLVELLIYYVLFIDCEVSDPCNVSLSIWVMCACVCVCPRACVCVCALCVSVTMTLFSFLSLSGVM